MKLIFTKITPNDILVHKGGAPATALGLGHSKMNYRFIERFIRDTQIKGEGNLQTAITQILTQFVDAYLERFAPKRLVSLRQMIESVKGDEDQVFTLAEGIGKTYLRVRKWADEDRPAGVWIEYETGSGNRGVTWEYEEESHVLDPGEAVFQLRMAFREGKMEHTRFITERQLRDNARRIAVDVIEGVLYDS